MYIPGFRTNHKTKKIIASIYYLLSASMIIQGIGYALFMLSLPFLFFSAIDVIKKKKGSAKVVLLVSGLIFILSMALIPRDVANNTQNNTPKPTQAQQTETPSPTITPYDTLVPTETPTPEPTPSKVSGRLEVHYIDVGQADSILIIRQDKAMLIDGGNNADSDLVKSYIQEQGIKKLDYVIGTHPDEDHIGGLDVVINTFDIGSIIMPKAQANTRTFEDLLSAIQNKNLKVTTPVPGNQYNLGDAAFVILAPNSSNYDDENNYSVVTKMTFSNTSFLFTGDAEAVSENEMLSKGFDLKADVLKVGHHGSNSSTTEEFLKAVSPGFAVISVGKDNSYGHPAPETLQKLQAAKVTTYRTDENGTIIAESDGDSITFKFQKHETINSPTPKPSASPSSTPKPGASVTPVPSNKGVIIDNVDLGGELVTLRNTTSSDVNLTGWKLVSVTGNQTYSFPQGSKIKAGSTLTIASGDASGDLKWTSKNIWNNSGDPAELYDNNGNLVSKK